MDPNFENQLIDELVAQGYSEDQVLDAIVELEDEQSFEGTCYASGKKAERQAKKDAKKKARAEKKAAKAAKKDEKKQAKAEKKSAKASDGKGLETAERIGGIVTGLGTTATGFINSLTNLKNSNGGTQKEVVYTNLPSSVDEEEEKKSNLPLILGIGAAVIIVVVIVIILKKKKK